MRTTIQLGCLLAMLLTACSEKPSEPAKLSDPEKRAIELARRAVAQFDDWADKAEFKIVRKNSQWHVTAWKVVYPQAKGNKRYVPWGRREIVIDDAGKVVDYRSGK
jgi:hypothetical protein